LSSFKGFELSPKAKIINFFPYFAKFFDISKEFNASAPVFGGK